MRGISYLLSVIRFRNLGRGQRARSKEQGAQVFLLRFTIHGLLADPLVSPLTWLNFLLLAPCSLLSPSCCLVVSGVVVSISRSTVHDSRSLVVSSRRSCSLPFT